LLQLGCSCCFRAAARAVSVTCFPGQADRAVVRELRDRHLAACEFVADMSRAFPTSLRRLPLGRLLGTLRPNVSAAACPQPAKADVPQCDRSQYHVLTNGPGRCGDIDRPTNWRGGSGRWPGCPY
jgi:hypothetical protein